MFKVMGYWALWTHGRFYNRYKNIFDYRTFGTGWEVEVQNRPITFVIGRKYVETNGKYCYMLDFLGSMTSAPCRVTMG
jgi:hypothetical protein